MTGGGPRREAGYRAGVQEQVSYEGALLGDPLEAEDVDPAEGTVLVDEDGRFVAVFDAVPSGSLVRVEVDPVDCGQDRRTRQKARRGTREEGRRS